MKTTGIVRNIDELGRIVVPKEMRRHLGITASDPIEIALEGDTIVLKKYVSLCHFCAGSDDLIDFKGKKICKKCVAQIIS